jgi:hypothetical protein
LIIPNTTGLPVAAFGVPSADEPPAAALLVAALLVVAAAALLVALVAPPELELEFDELPHAATKTAATAHAPTIAPRFLSIPFISPSL